MSKTQPNILSIFDSAEPYSGSSVDPFSRKEYELSQTRKIINKLYKYTEDVKIFIEQSPGLKIASDFKLNNADIVAKNISWLTSLSVLKLDHIQFTIDEGDPTSYEELITRARIIAQKISPFQQLYSVGIVIPVPTTLEEYDGIYNSSSTIDLGKSIMDVGFSNHFLEQQFTERPTMPSPCGILELLLPRVAQIPQQEIINLRRDNGATFTHFQEELVKFIGKSQETNSETKLRDLLLHIDEETRRLRNEFEKIDKKRHLEQLGLAYSFGVVFVSTCITIRGL